MKKQLAMLLTAAVVMGLSACGSSDTATESSAAGAESAETAETEAAGDAEASDSGTDTAAQGDQVLRVVQPNDPGTFEPGRTDEQSYQRIVQQIYDTLTRFDENGEVVPSLAESWEMLDETHWQFNLREGVKFSDGSDFTANDVLFTIRHNIEENLPNAHYNMIDIDNCTAEDDHTVILALKYPCVTLPNHLANGQCVIASEKAYEEFGGDYINGAAVGTGAYKLVSYTQGDLIKLTANEYYWKADEGKPYIKDVEMRVIASTDASATEAKTGAYDILIGTNTREYENIEAVDGMHMELTPTAKTIYLLMNCKKAPMDDVRVREAFARAIDIKTTVELAYGSTGRPAEAFITPGILGSNSETYKKFFGEGRDIETAKALLAEAGYADGIDIEITVESPDTQRCDMAEAMQAQVAEAGINLSINKMDYATIKEYLSQGNHQICIYGFTANTMEADGFLNQLQPGSDALNRIGYDNQEFFDRYQEGCAEPDREARGQIWEDCLEMLMEDYVAVPLSHYQLHVAVNDRIEGYWAPQDYEELFYEDFSIKAE